MRVTAVELGPSACGHEDEDVASPRPRMAQAHADEQRMIAAALDGDAAAMRALVQRIEPIVRVRAGRALYRRRREARGRDLRGEMEDFVQEVFAALFAKGGKALRAWEPERGLPFDRFVGFLAEREVNAVLRTGRRSPWTEDPTMDDKLHHLSGAAESHQRRVESREMLALVAARMQERLSPLGLHYFQRLFVEQRPVAAVASECGVSTDSLYAWRSRLGRVLRSIRAELAEASDDE
jgi:RNA polymerase sigma-70 factor (ECF subfamily)